MQWYGKLNRTFGYDFKINYSNTIIIKFIYIDELVMEM